MNAYRRMIGPDGFIAAVLIYAVGWTVWLARGGSGTAPFWITVSGVAGWCGVDLYLNRRRPPL